MARATSDLLKEALELPRKERAHMATELLASLDEEPFESEIEVQKAWAEEIDRRVRQIRDENIVGVDWRVALDEIRKEVRER